MKIRNTFDLERSDASYAEYVEKFAPLSNFLADYEYRKNLLDLTQAELAEKMETTQSAVSRFESLKHPPTYNLLRKASAALGDTLFLSPLGSMTVTLPYDLEESGRQTAIQKGMSLKELMLDYIRDGLSRERFVVMNSGKMRIENQDEVPQIGDLEQWGKAVVTKKIPCEGLAG